MTEGPQPQEGGPAGGIVRGRDADTAVWAAIYALRLGDFTMSRERRGRLAALGADPAVDEGFHAP